MNTIRIFVPIDRMDATAWFYSDGLGLREVERAGDKRVFLSGEGQLVELVSLLAPFWNRGHMSGFMFTDLMNASGISYRRVIYRARAWQNHGLIGGKLKSATRPVI